MSDLQSARELAPDWLSPPAGLQAAHAQDKAVIARGKALRPFASSSRAASAVSVAAVAARVAADLLSASLATPTKRTRTDRCAASSEEDSSAKKGTKPSSTDRCAASSEKDSSLPCSEIWRNDAEVAPAAVKQTRKYMLRGTAGTFKGKRPPKNAMLLQEFLKKKAAYEAQKEKLREKKAVDKAKSKLRRRTPTQEDYQAWQRVYDRSQSSCSRARFIEAAAAWQTMRANQVADSV